MGHRVVRVGDHRGVRVLTAPVSLGWGPALAARRGPLTCSVCDSARRAGIMSLPPAVRTPDLRTANRWNRYDSAANRTDGHGSDRRHLEVADEAAGRRRQGTRRALPSDVRMDLDLSGHLRAGPHVLPADLDVDHAV